MYTITHGPLWVYLDCNLAFLNIEYEIFNSILNDKIINQVALAGPHKISTRAFIDLTEIF